MARLGGFPEPVGNGLHLSPADRRLGLAYANVLSGSAVIATRFAATRTVARRRALWTALRRR